MVLKSNKRKKFILILVCTFILLCLSLANLYSLGPEPLSAQDFEDQQRGAVHLIPLEGNVEPGMATFLSRALNDAEEAGAEKVIVEINTFGGLVDSAIKIRDLIVDFDLKTIAFVNNRAWSAGALITLAADEIYIVEGGSIGSAETRPMDEKIISALRSEFASTAERRGRDPDIARAMVDADIEIEGLSERGKLLSLSATEAEELGFIEGKVSDRNDFYAKLGLSEADIFTAEKTNLEIVAGVITNPYVSILLLTVGILGLVGEAMIPGFGVSGTIGVLSLGLFFTGYLVEGYAGLGMVVLFLAGLVLIAIELFIIPGFGITGIGGITAIVASLFLVLPDAQLAWRIMAAVLLLTVVGSIILIKIFGTSKFWHKISLKQSETVEEGYTSSRAERDLTGYQGKAITPLRPAGTAEIDGKRIDVISEGGFVDRGAKIEVLRMEGSKVIVEEIDFEE